MTIIVRDIMTSDPITVEASTSLLDIIELMKSFGCRQLPVVENGYVIGIVTDRDVRLAMHSPLLPHDHHEDIDLLQNACAQDCMTPRPMTIAPDMAAVFAAEILNHYKFGALPVVEHRRLVGILTVSDVLRHYVKLVRQQ